MLLLIYGDRKSHPAAVTKCTLKVCVQHTTASHLRGGDALQPDGKTLSVSLMKNLWVLNKSAENGWRGLSTGTTVGI